jgi:hypothetical protein
MTLDSADRAPGALVEVMLDDSSISLPVPHRSSGFCWYLPSDPIEPGVDGGGSLSAFIHTLGVTR